MSLQENEQARLEALRAERQTLSRRTPGDIAIIAVRVALTILIVKATMHTAQLWAFAAFAFSAIGLFASFVVPLFNERNPRERIREIDRELATLTAPGEASETT